VIGCKLPSVSGLVQLKFHKEQEIYKWQEGEGGGDANCPIAILADAWTRGRSLAVDLRVKNALDFADVCIWALVVSILATFHSFYLFQNGLAEGHVSLVLLASLPVTRTE
jgi:hypothetical protein